jgi:Protein of unknown function (DUF3551)
LRLKMVRMVFAAVVALAAVVVGLQWARAYEAPWCAVINTGPYVHWDCQYQSLEQCYPTVLADNRGFCNPSPYFVANPTEHRRSAKRHARPQ